jgi:Protein of unknown function (DUF1638)
MTPAPAIRRVSPPRKRGSRAPLRALAAASSRQTSTPHDPGPPVRGDDSLGEGAAADIFAEASYPRRRDGARRILVIACGALAREALALRLDHIDVACLPAQLHNHPRRIPDAMRAKIRANRSSYDEILCLYGDCGTGGELDRVLEEEGVRRIDGAHCYAFYAGDEAFSRLSEEEPGTFYLTDFLVRHFDALIIRGLGLDRFPQLRDDYFGNYRRVVHLAQFDDPELTAKAKAAADRLGLAFERRFTGLEGIRAFLDSATETRQAPWPA